MANQTHWLKIRTHYDETEHQHYHLIDVKLVTMVSLFYSIIARFSKFWVWLFDNMSEPFPLLVLQKPRKTLHKKWSFPLQISSVNVTKSAVCETVMQNFIFVNWSSFPVHQSGCSRTAFFHNSTFILKTVEWNPEKMSFQKTIDINH